MYFSGMRSGFYTRWLLPISLALAVKLFSSFPQAVESGYSQGLYPWLARFFRFFFGWLPFSIGDILLMVVIGWLLVKLVAGIRSLIKRTATRAGTGLKALKALRYMIWIYVIFNLFWGINYNRPGIASQLQLELKPYKLSELNQMAEVLLKRINQYAPLADSADRLELRRNAYLFREARISYQQAAREFPFLAYPPSSLKASIFSELGNYMGFQGYFNPLTGEAQVNTTVPDLLRPFIATHEMAHQLGYARENEANFVGYLAARRSENPTFRYSTYYDMFWYTFREIQFRDTLAARQLYNRLDTVVKIDNRRVRTFFRSYKNPFEPVVRWFYGQYLRANQQPGGIESYNEVTALLLAWYKKAGEEGL